MGRAETLDLVVLRNGFEDGRFQTSADPDDHSQLRELLLDYMDREHGVNEHSLDEFTMDVYNQYRTEPIFRFVPAATAF